MTVSEYDWLIVLAVTVFLVGSVTWVMPTRHQRQQTRLRQQAMTMGMQVRISRLQWPRENGKIAPSSMLATGYCLPRHPISKHSKSGCLANHNWEVFRAQGQHRNGLPVGWFWNRGEGELTAEQLDRLITILSQLPDDVYAVSVNPLAAIVYWHETGDQQCLDDIYFGLQQLLQ